MNLTPRGAFVRWLPASLWAAVILTATSWPNVGAPSVRFIDKFVHLGLYAGLGWLATCALAAGGRRAWSAAARAVAVVAVFGAVDEWHQRFIPGRSASAADWAADLTGGAGGALAAAAALRILRFRRA